MHELCNDLRPQWKAGVALPSEKLVFEAFRLTPFKRVKVVILGQDPYYRSGKAMGVAFSVPAGHRPHPLSLRNIMHAVQTDTGIAPAMSGDLTRWAEKEDVLLLNRTLTVREGSGGSHRGMGWAQFTREAIKLLNQRDERPVVFLLWGADAKAAAGLVTAPQHRVLCADHPAAPGDGFFESHPFSDTNEFLNNAGLPRIDWNY